MLIDGKDKVGIDSSVNEAQEVCITLIVHVSAAQQQFWPGVGQEIKLAYCAGANLCHGIDTMQKYNPDQQSHN